jgi:4-hydroxybenzoate polyprenyltransferase
MNQLSLFLDLTRLRKPIGYMLLFWPCAWGLTIGFDFSDNKKLYIFYLLLFLIGAILMRSAGCIINDIADRKFDKKVFRTKNRPIASGKISVRLGFCYAMLLCLMALLVLINFNLFTIYIALASMPLAFTYPLMKRFTYWPQLFLGITFNYGLLLGWSSINNQINLIPIIFYFGAIFWTLGYDTIYGFQDIKDDEIIGLKSTSIKFKKTPYAFLYMSYLIFFFSLIIVGYLIKFNYFFYMMLIPIFLQLFIIQIKKVNLKNSKNCLETFKSNNYLGFLVFSSLVIGKL